AVGPRPDAGGTHHPLRRAGPGYPVPGRGAGRGVAFVCRPAADRRHSVLTVAAALPPGHRRHGLMSSSLAAHTARSPAGRHRPRPSCGHPPIFARPPTPERPTMTHRQTASGTQAPTPLILVLNCGSSSIKFALFDAAAEPLPRTPRWGGKVQGIGTPGAV